MKKASFKYLCFSQVKLDITILNKRFMHCVKLMLKQKCCFINEDVSAVQHKGQVGFL